MAETVSNVTNEILVVGGIYNNPELIVEYSQYIRSKYDFYDDATRFFYDSAEIIFSTRSQKFNQTVVNTFMAEDADRLATYKKLGGWSLVKNWMQLSVADNFKNYYEVLKKFSLLREYQRNGFDVSKIMGHKQFETFTAIDIYRLIRGKTDKIQTVILNNDNGEVLNSKVLDMVIQCLEKPDMGLTLPFSIINDMFRGLKTKTVMAVGALSNAGKSRFMCKVFAYLALIHKQKVAVLLNEMTVEEMRFALLTTVINNPEYQELHGVKIKKREREITLGLYRDDSGKFVYRKQDSNGAFIESIEDYVERLTNTSKEYRDVMRVSEWIEQESEGLIFVKDMSSGYSDKLIEFEIRKAKLVQGCQYFFYDTLKSDEKGSGDWSALKNTTTMLTELAKQLDVFIYASIQLTDDATYLAPDQATSNQIANAKQLKHPLHSLLLFLEIPKKDFKKYGYYVMDRDWGSPVIKDLDDNKRYGIFNTDKNRFGSKEKIVMEYNLDLNVWVQCGVAGRK